MKTSKDGRRATFNKLTVVLSHVIIALATERMLLDDAVKG